MSDKTSIQWTDATFNPWWGCSKVSPGCDNCYAERDAKRYQPGKVLWGVGSERRLFGADHWNQPIYWNRKAVKENRRIRVFCASMADVFDKDAPLEARQQLGNLIEATPMLDWQLLTKRIGNAKAMYPGWVHFGFPANVWLGISVVNQEEADRDIPKLLALPARTRFLSCEPLLDSIQLGIGDEFFDYGFGSKSGLHWVIVGGESGNNARPFNIEWANQIIGQCKAANVPCFVKQLGARPFLHTESSISHDEPGLKLRVQSIEMDTSFTLRDRKGGDTNEWPEHLRVRQFPLANS